KVTFTNTDTADHDVTARLDGANGKPLFQSAKVAAGQSAPVTGAETLKPGTYDYWCSIHNFMKGTITVTGDGSSGGGSGGPSGGGQPSGSDTTPASVSVKVLDTKRAA